MIRAGSEETAGIAQIEPRRVRATRGRLRNLGPGLGTRRPHALATSVPASRHHQHGPRLPPREPPPDRQTVPPLPPGRIGGCVASP
jgi:hypothetical protein